MFRNIVIGVSGGVDSAISALLLKQKGYNVIGLFMKNWDEFDEMGACSGEQDYRDAEFTCQKLDIELHMVNYVKEYWNSVFRCKLGFPLPVSFFFRFFFSYISAFLEDYQNGLTPNPDILCNKYIKFDLFYKYARGHLHGDAIATGHYAKTSFGNFLEHYNANGDVNLLIPRDTFKDQTFFLSGIQRHTLSRTMFPLGDSLKSDVKLLARKCGLERLAHKKESTGICFVDIDSGHIVGTHGGIHEWTIGQRCRLASYLRPYFVAKKDVANNTIYVASGHEHPSLYSDIINASAPNWLCNDPLGAGTSELRCRFRFQHTKPLVDCTVKRTKGNTSGVVITLDKPLRALTPGQYAVFYSGSACLGSARIISASAKVAESENKLARVGVEERVRSMKQR
ncbi:mitochondrial tRNA-specific 2-thiouridylase 1 isoform X3 [Ceratitis capitata]|uniref:mitochondrial tRNA-specific 2-thiouridylase 1 isoform X3 n=1 Tax=Ceratitis capitata TaxID=7213 RepID=UPI000A103AD6|nr:mitochondrial tRNA-specific 2-thiouridylase 1 isoform X3 [Ceratitis capitata]